MGCPWMRMAGAICVSSGNSNVKEQDCPREGRIRRIPGVMGKGSGPARLVYCLVDRCPRILILIWIDVGHGVSSPAGASDTLSCTTSCVKPLYVRLFRGIQEENRTFLEIVPTGPSWGGRRPRGGLTSRPQAHLHLWACIRSRCSPRQTP